MKNIISFICRPMVLPFWRGSISVIAWKAVTSSFPGSSDSKLRHILTAPSSTKLSWHSKKYIWQVTDCNYYSNTTFTYTFPNWHVTNCKYYYSNMTFTYTLPSSLSSLHDIFSHLPDPHRSNVSSWGFMNSTEETREVRWWPFTNRLFRVPISQSHMLETCIHKLYMLNAHIRFKIHAR